MFVINPPVVCTLHCRYPEAICFFSQAIQEVQNPLPPPYGNGDMNRTGKVNRVLCSSFLFPNKPYNCLLISLASPGAELRG